MSLFFPDLNVWLALSVKGHVHNAQAIRWLHRVRAEDRLIFNRYTQIGFLRLLTNAHIAHRPCNTGEAWHMYDHWLSDPRVEFYSEPRSIEIAFRQTTAPFSSQAASKSIGDCYLLAFARETKTVLVTFDQALVNLAAQLQYPVVTP